MDYQLLMPLLPSVKRMRMLHRKYPNTTVLRKLIYEQLQSAQLSGRCLDIGGGQNSPYISMVPDYVNIESVNVNSLYKPTHLVKVGEPYPYPDNHFNCIICLSVLEHIYDAKFVIREMHRVLKTGGTAYIAVPFMFGIHGNPDDYSRHTPSWWRLTMQSCGFTTMIIEATVWGRYTNINIHSYWSAWIKDIVIARVLSNGTKRYPDRHGEKLNSKALGWWISVAK